MTPRPLSERLTAADARTLTAARRVLHRLNDETGPSHEWDRHDNYRLGILNQACETAGDALFHVLSVASSRLDSQAARSALRENVYT